MHFGNRGVAATVVDEVKAQTPFWKVKTLFELSPEEWESLCDGCGRCCLNKLEDEETAEIFWTNVACHMLDGHGCNCKDYANRLDHVPDCIQLSPDMVEELGWLPPTCAYRLVQEGKDLHPWHHLVSGSRETVHEAGVSVRGRTVPDYEIGPDAFEDYIVEWPGEDWVKDSGPRNLVLDTVTVKE